MGSIFVFLALGIASFASGTSVLQYFIGHADCEGVPYGWLVKNPLDCGSYFVCEDEIKYERCPSLLHFDVEIRVCNWPNRAKCDWTVLPPIVMPNEDNGNIETATQASTTTTIKPPTTAVRTSRAPTTIQPPSKPSSTRQPTTTTTQKPVPTAPQLSTQSTPLTNVEMKWICENVVLKDTIVGEVESDFGAYDSVSGKIIDPLVTFDPKKVSCLYDGVYFLPHPTACDNYYICSHRTLIAHSCGAGVSWNFKTNKCDVSIISSCYKKDSRKGNESTLGIPVASTETTTTPTTTERVTRYVTPEKPKTTLNERLPKCPMNIQTYYPHSEDCRKYYICIAGLPVLTTCPDELYWDDTHKFCGLPQYTECKVKQN